MGMIPDQVMDAIHFAEFVLAKEKQDRIGRPEAVVYPMKFFCFHGQKEILGSNPSSGSGIFANVWAWRRATHSANQSALTAGNYVCA